LTVYRDKKKWDIFDELVPEFIQDMDEMLTKAGFIFGEQWKRISQKESFE